MFEWGKNVLFLIIFWIVGSVGDKFYIILQGTVSVQLPSESYKKKINDLVKEEIIKMLGQMG